MILDSLQHTDLYRRLGERFAAAFDFLRDTDLGQLPPGRLDIDGDNLYATVMEIDLKPAAEGLWEAHRLYTDIQVVIDGTERMGVAEIPALTVTTPYDPQGDATLFRGAGQTILIPAGRFAIFFPQDAHMPGLRPTDVTAAHSRKVVVKVRNR